MYKLQLALFFKKRIILFLLFSVFSLSLSAQSLEKDTIKMSALTIYSNGKTETVNWMNISLAEAAAKAKAENKDILLYFTAKWCGPCLVMEQNVYPNYKIIRAINDNYIALKIDVDAWGGKKWQKDFGVKAFPNFFILDPKLIKLRHTIGGMDVKKMLEFLELKVMPSDQQILDTSFVKLRDERWRSKIAVAAGAGFSKIGAFERNNIFAYEFKLGINIEKKRLLFSSGINFSGIGATQNRLNYIKLPVEIGLNVYRGKVGWLAGGYRILAGPYYSRLLNSPTTPLNKNDLGLEYGIGVYIGDVDRLSLELAIKGSQGFTDVFPSAIGKQANQFFRISTTLGIRY